MPDKNEAEHQEINKKLDIQFDKLNEILKILNGNGKVGMCAKVNIIWGCGLFVLIAFVGTWIRMFING